jgi:hypothetical protein
MHLLYRASVGRATWEGVLVVAVLFPLHFLLERPHPSVASNLLILLLFFVPPIWMALRLRTSPRPAPWHILEYALFGFQLGLWGGMVGGIELVLLKVVAGEPFLVPLTTWVMIAFIFAWASGTAYAVFVLLLRAILALGQDATLPSTLIFRGSVTPDTPSLRRAILYSVIPGVGHYYLHRSGRGAAYLGVACSVALLGLFTGTAAVVLLVEGRVMPTHYLIAAALLILSPVFLAIVAAVDVYVTSHNALERPRMADTESNS